MRPLVILGATGSIGRQALEVASRLGIPVVGLAARRGSDAFYEIAAAHPDAQVAVAAPSAAERERFVGLGRRVDFGTAAVAGLSQIPTAIVLNGIVGAAGLPASIAALEAGNRLALANKESLVTAGPLVLEAKVRGGGELLPVDSEHSALFQCLVGEAPETVRRLVLTASGGPLRGKSRAEIEAAGPSEVLAHPTWSMGPRITVDSATLVNKGFEVIEAHHLFGIPYERIDVVVHPQSIVHSLVEFVDGSVKAQLGEPDMRVPIQYAITYPDRIEAPGAGLDLRTLEFAPRDPATTPAFDIVVEAGRRGGAAPIAVNAADEVAVQAFLDGRIGLFGLVSVLEGVLRRVEEREVRSVADVMEIDREARALAVQEAGLAC